MSRSSGRTIWFRSSKCVNAGCVEVAADDGRILVRDSKLDTSPILSFTSEEWGAFVAGVKACEFDEVAARR